MTTEDNQVPYTPEPENGGNQTGVSYPGGAQRVPFKEDKLDMGTSTARPSEHQKPRHKVTLNAAEVAAAADLAAQAKANPPKSISARINEVVGPPPSDPLVIPDGEPADVIDLTGNQYQGYAKRAYHSASIPSVDLSDDPDVGDLFDESPEPADDHLSDEEDGGEEYSDQEELSAPPDEEGGDPLANLEQAALEPALPKKREIPAPVAVATTDWGTDDAKEPAEVEIAPPAAKQEVPAEPEKEEDPNPDGIIQSIAALDLGFEIDLNKIGYSDRNSVEQEQILKSMFAVNPTIQVVLTQSGYSLDLTALTLAEIHAIGVSSGDLYSQKEKVFRTVYNHIKGASIGKIGFIDWMKLTSFYDLPTLYYGLYCMTFPDSNPFDVTCGACKKVTPLDVNNMSLIRQIPKSTRKRVEDVLKTKDVATMIQESQVLVAAKSFLPGIKAMIELRTPSLFDYLSLTREIKREQVENFKATVGMMLFVKRILALDVETSKSLQRAVFFAVDPLKNFDLLASLSREDGSALSKTIAEMMEQYQINYAIRKSACKHCAQTIPEIPLDMETILFNKIDQEVEA
jgi:hypothetical protein